ncbi:uncharacterized protein [Henckelia pumila]|uniref:uncharacterized protein n=1 Tax=Henckelia pumila TaxID=405737 RepID=UPI003C6E3E16
MNLALVELAYNNSYYSSIDMAPFEALYRRRCRTPLFLDEVGKLQVEGPQIIQHMSDAVEMIRKRNKASQDRQDSYDNTHRRPLHFKVGEHVFLIHDVFHVFSLRQYVADESHILHPTEVQLDQDLSYVKRTIRILDRKDKMLQNKRIPLVMVLWQRRETEKATWELESRMRAEHPELF